MLVHGVDRWLIGYFERRFPYHLARDLAQQSNELIWERFSSFAPVHDEAFARWVGSVARIQALRAARGQSRRDAELGRDVDLSALVHDGTGPITALERQEKRDLLARELDRLAEPFRRAVEDQLAGGDVESFAKKEATAAATIRTRRHRAKIELKRRIRAKLRASATPST
ncbi:hypothetical protein PPSIR1_06136 [Plesiocystis pacifica SIR-1]|uniref:RNA polymerase sigma-70 region 2 domain-containing protein n=2 Tax=Plesiocystis pacifica TaxID=191768 RepID=A6G6V2_9BACT|nr:hypothetical protein PPSIR1_06136 [Plesiocystis pacifica SIR-1]